MVHRCYKTLKELYYCFIQLLYDVEGLSEDKNAYEIIIMLHDNGMFVVQKACIGDADNYFHVAVLSSKRGRLCLR